MAAECCFRLISAQFPPKLPQNGGQGPGITLWTLWTAGENLAIYAGKFGPESLPCEFQAGTAHHGAET
jgi:hypothetical protein